MFTSLWPFCRDTNLQHSHIWWLEEIQPQWVRRSWTCYYAIKCTFLSPLLGRQEASLTPTLPDDRHASHEVTSVSTEQTHTTSLDLLRLAAEVGTTAAFAASMLHLLASLAARCWIDVDLAELHAITSRRWNSEHYKRRRTPRDYKSFPPYLPTYLPPSLPRYLSTYVPPLPSFPPSLELPSFAQDIWV